MFKNLFKKGNWGVITLVFLPVLKEGIEDLLDMLKDKTPSYVDRVIDAVNQKFITGLIDIKTDNIKDDAGQLKEMWRKERKSFALTVTDAGAEGLQEIIAEKDLIKNDDVEFVISTQLAALRKSLQDLAVLEDNNATEEQKNEARSRFAEAKKKPLPLA